jgi:hypothetical protein
MGAENIETKPAATERNARGGPMSTIDTQATNVGNLTRDNLKS